MRRVVVVAAVLACIALVFAMSRCRSDQSSTAPSVAQPSKRERRVNPAKLAPGSIAGRVVDAKGAPIGNAFVCADEPPCVRTNAAGAFELGPLPPATYAVSATARAFRAEQRDVILGANERKTIELRLRAGGVEITGVVLDANAGPIAGALVGSKFAATESASDGTFSLWVKPGRAMVRATAEGYVHSHEWTYAPGRVEITLLPEGSITGRVVDSISGEAIAGANVDVDSAEGGGSSVQTDESGTFRATKLSPGRYELTATSAHRYGRSVGSVLVQLGAQTAGVVIQVTPAARVTGNVIVSSSKKPCPDAWVTLDDYAKDRHAEMASDARGALAADGVLPGEYTVVVRCKGHRPRVYAPLRVLGADVSGMWEVDPAARIEGTVRNESGDLLEDIHIVARTNNRGRESAFTDVDGKYVLEGLAAGSHTIDVGVTNYLPQPARVDQIEIAAGSTHRRDYVVPDVGRIEGRVVKKDGRPGGGAVVRAQRDEHGELADASTEADANGVFAFDAMPPGAYAVTVTSLGAKKARATVTVRAKQTSPLTFTIDDRTGSISGTVVDAANKPVDDAFVTVAHESNPARYRLDAARDVDPLVTNSDGSFVIANLPAGSYFVAASRRGTGETATVDNVAVGSSVKLRLARSGSIRGTVHSGNSTLDELSIDIRERLGETIRREHFFRTGGWFALVDLPAGHFTITAGAEGREAAVEVDLAEGEQKTGLSINLATLVTVVGRTVDHLTHAPVEGVTVRAMPVDGHASKFSMIADPRGGWKTDAAGRFTLPNTPLGRLVFECIAPKGFKDTKTERKVSGSGTVDIGDIPIIAPRVSEEEPQASIGIAVRYAPGQVEVLEVDANGPAAKAGIRAGDIITSIDGFDTRGWASENAPALLLAPPGTTFRITLARGVTVDVVSAKR